MGSSPQVALSRYSLTLLLMRPAAIANLARLGPLRPFPGAQRGKAAADVSHLRTTSVVSIFNARAEFMAGRREALEREGC